MATYTIAEYSKMLDKRLDSFVNSKAVGQVYSTILADMVIRIFEEGKNSSGDFIGKYSTNDTYINTEKESPKKLPARGKNGNTKFKDGNPHKTTFFGGGYKEFKGKIGRGSSFVNLRLFGLLQNDMAAGLIKKGDVWQIALKRQFNADKARGNEDRFDHKIFALTTDERAKVTRLMAIQFAKQFK